MHMYMHIYIYIYIYIQTNILIYTVHGLPTVRSELRPEPVFWPVILVPVNSVAILHKCFGSDIADSSKYRQNIAIPKVLVT